MLIRISLLLSSMARLFCLSLKRISFCKVYHIFLVYIRCMYFSTDILDGSRRWPQSLQLLGIAIGNYCSLSDLRLSAHKLSLSPIIFMGNVYYRLCLQSYKKYTITFPINRINNPLSRCSVHNISCYCLSAIVRCYNKISQSDSTYFCSCLVESFSTQMIRTD